MIITNPISNIPKKEKSHTRGWAAAWSRQLGAQINHKCTADILDHDVVYLEHGANFQGSLNLFGGATEEIYDRINLVASCKNVISLDHDQPNWGEQLRKRIGAKTTYPGITEDWCDHLTKRLSTIQSFKQEDVSLDNIIIGDSHTIAFADSTDRIYRYDGKTLHGAMELGFNELLRGSPAKKITLCFGSVDIRHHLLRHETDIPSLVARYVDTGDKMSADVQYCYPVPVEFEGRRIPKSGFYKKTPFFGSFEERREVTKQFCSELEKNAPGRCVTPPADWYTMDGEEYANTIMEHGSSFHISPPFYRTSNWGNTSPIGRG